MTLMPPATLAQGALMFQRLMSLNSRTPAYNRQACA